MKYLAILTLAALASATPEKRATPLGIDVSSYQPDVDWTTVKNNGVSFVYIKATEGTDYISPSFSNQYIGATDAGLIRGGYHFAHPDLSTGATQADYFLANGGGWSADGITLPGALDIEYNPSGSECYGLTTSQMVSWIQSFSNTYEAATSRAAFANTNPLWIAIYSSSVGTLPAGWQYETFWQYADSGANPGDC
ncbi:glycoside hydrolase family 25 protein [Suillus paluster]|uniref:glycoside hydrolase family 25 protein n=1 Tax=Suillus paluster TaxID=48578 RepID=UPI001B862DE7|nr:glycoside hydrolase family 25 protein [Suillus paluster]KAG1728167.1 glycoside hydrolase family 25 protein [Suillus paluster]